MRLIDADKLVVDLKEFVENIKNIREDSKCFLTEENVLSIIDEQPTAYDVDKVISNIWDKSELIHIKHTHNDEIEDYIRTTDASEIIRVGGIDEKN